MRLSPLCLLTLALATLGLSCSDPVPPTPRGAWTVSFVQQSAVDCKQAGHNSQVGAVTSNTKTSVITDGTDSTHVSCTVSDVGGGNFSVNAEAQKSDKYLNIVINKISAAATEAAPATGGIAYASANTVKTYTSDAMTPCNFYFVPSSGEGVAAGKVWVAFKCPKIVADMSTCEIQQGYAIFENCGD